MLMSRFVDFPEMGNLKIWICDSCNLHNISDVFRIKLINLHLIEQYVFEMNQDWYMGLLGYIVFRNILKINFYIIIKP